jgi:hypothetical protein
LRLINQAIGGVVQITPLDDESERESRQPVINRDSGRQGQAGRPLQGATRGESLSREVRKPQIESVKKNLVIESSESTLESFAL